MDNNVKNEHSLKHVPINFVISLEFTDTEPNYSFFLDQ